MTPQASASSQRVAEMIFGPSLRYVSWLARMLWACRVSVLSAAAGFWLLGYVGQAQDLFADISYGALPESLRAWLHWSWFFFCVFLIWAFPVHYAARWALDGDAWVVPWRLRGASSDVARQVRQDYRGTLLWLPRLLGCLPFFAVLLGLRRADAVLERTPQFAPSLAAHEQIAWLYGFTVAVLLGFLVFVVMRRRLIGARLAESWIVFENFVFLFLIAAWGAYALAENAPALQRYINAHTVADLAQTLGLFASLLFVIVALIRVRGLAGFAWCSLFATFLIYAFAYKWPFLLANFAPRAVVVPFLFGSLVLFAGWLARLGARIGVPLLEISIAVAVIATGLNDRFNDLRTFKTASPELGLRQIEIDEAIEKWEDANGCTRENDGDKRKCPPALIVAAEGGASRAAFATAAALGYLFDRENAAPEVDPPGQALTQRSPARQVFAISGVSGGAFGAASIRTALWESLERNETAPPCRRASRLWFKQEADVSRSWRACLEALMVGDYLTPAFLGLGLRDNVAPRLYFLPGAPSALREDRAALVERAFEHHFDYVTKASLDTYESFVDNGTPFAAREEKGLKRRFGYMKQALEKEKGAWLPLLLLNGTSVNDGARIIASDLVSTQPTKEGDKRESLYPAAYDLFEMLSAPCQPSAIHDDACDESHTAGKDKPERRDGQDVRLSTAAMMSARFPVVSPSGTIRAKDDARHGDRVVDGGYFENAGLTTALDVARALKRRGLTPLILWVQNDPAGDLGDKQDGAKVPAFPPRAAGAPRLDAAQATGAERFFGVLATPFHALLSTRGGHALEEATLVQETLEQWNKGGGPRDNPSAIGASYFEFKVFKVPRFDRDEKADENVRPDKALDAECASLAGKRPQTSEVSMSWWLSQSVQAELDSQVCDWRNRRTLGDLIERLSQSLEVKLD
jgi:hypothetical protein